MGYAAGFDDEAVEIAVDHLRRRSGELVGELTVECGLVERYGGHLHRANFNLSSTTARNTLAKTLDERARPHQIDWRGLLESFCMAVLGKEREGAPIQTVGHLPARAAQAYRIGPLLPEGKTTIIYAAGGTGKSFLATGMAVAVASGHGFIGYPVHPGGVLYLDWETDAYEIDDRVKKVAAGMAVATPQIHYRACAGSFDDMTEEVSRFVDEQGIGLVIIDSVGMATAASRDGGDANESAIRLFTALRHLSTTVLALDHITGDDVKAEKAVAKPYGSIYKVNLARSVFELRRSTSEDEQIHLALFHRKVNNGKPLKPIGIRMDHTDTAVTFRKEEVEEIDLVAATSNATRIGRALHIGPLTVEQIAEATGVTTGSVRTTLNRGRGSLFVKMPDGRWANAFMEEVSGAA